MPNSSVHAYSDYSDYMSKLKSCRFAIGTVPFGGSNSNIDLLRLAVPKLFVTDNRDLPGLTDSQLWQSFDILDGECHSIDELTERAVDWVTNDVDIGKVVAEMKSPRIAALLNDCEQLTDYDDRLLEGLQLAIDEKKSN